MAMVVGNVNNDLGKKIEKLVDVAVTYGKVGWASVVHQGPIWPLRRCEAAVERHSGDTRQCDGMCGEARTGVA